MSKTATSTPDMTKIPAESEQKPNNSSKGSNDFSPEERETIVAMAKELGVSKVAREFGIRARLISYWLHQEKKKASKPSKPLKTSEQTKAKGKDSKRTLGRKKEIEHIAEDTPTVTAEPIKAIEPAKTNKPAKLVERKTVSAKPQEIREEKQVLVDRQALIIENAVLKERISALNAEIEKLRAALTSLM